jgi:transposase
MVVTAAQRLGLAPRLAPLDSTSFHVDGRDTSDEAPDEHVMHMTRGYRRDQRPDLNHVMLDLIVEHQAAIPVRMKPLRGNSSDAQGFGQLIIDQMAPLELTSGTTFLVADRALYRAENLQKLAETPSKWITRFPRDLERRTGGIGPGRSADDGSSHGG